MFRTHETSNAWKAGFLAVLVHALLLGALLFSFNWKAAHTIVSVNQVELWDALPTAKPAPKQQIAKPKPKVPEVKQPEPQPEPVVEKPEPKPEPETPKVDIELENKKKAEAEKKKKAEAEKKKIADERKKKLAALQKELLDDVDPAKIRLRKLQAEIGNEDTKPAPAVNQGIVNEYMAKIQNKVRGNVNSGFCMDGSPTLTFKVSLLPTGDFSSAPVLSKSSGNAACDDAVERALIASEPLPLPSDPDALSEFRNLNLTFKPNE